MYVHNEKDVLVYTLVKTDSHKNVWLKIYWHQHGILESNKTVQGKVGGGHKADVRKMIV